MKIPISVSEFGQVKTVEIVAPWKSTDIYVQTNVKIKNKQKEVKSSTLLLDYNVTT